MVSQIKQYLKERNKNGKRNNKIKIIKKKID